MPLNRFQHFWRERFLNHFQHSRALVGASRDLVTYSWLQVERIYVKVICQHDKASCRASESLALV